MGECLDENVLARLVGGARADPALDAHLRACADCREALALLDSSRATAAAGEVGPGRRVGRYRVDEELGRGGMGVVYIGRDEALGRDVAIKVLDQRRAAPRARDRLVREARALAALSHDNVAAIYDVVLRDGEVFVVMELLRGRTLREWVAAARPSWRETVAAYLDAARGLGAAHARDLVHRDVKPDNIMRGDDGRIKVLDFGLARRRGSEDTSAGSGRRAAASGSLTETGDQIYVVGGGGENGNVWNPWDTTEKYNFTDWPAGSWTYDDDLMVSPA
ncbi:MAG: serine/threonine-protein kinase, partial [Myxococcota bacterium]